MSIDLTLDRVRDLYSQFEKYTRPTVHIAGTNGKGSVAALLNSIFSAAGLVVGRFNSPHLIVPSDCISIDSKPISEDNFTSIRSEVTRRNDEMDFCASTFEILTVTALLAFERAKVDVVLCEVGLGGRLDATNVIPDDAVLVSVITSISLDHTAFLGSTPGLIAREKAGIVRRNGVVVLAQQAYVEAVAVVKEVTSSLGARCIDAPVANVRDWEEHVDGPTPPPFSLVPYSTPAPTPVTVVVSDPERFEYKLLLSLHGLHQLENLGAALAIFHHLRSGFSTSLSQKIYERLSQIDDVTLLTAIKGCSWPGRLSFHTLPTTSGEMCASQWKDLVVLADGAHNEAASETLASYISKLISSLKERATSVTLTFILGLSHSPPKTPESVLAPLLSIPRNIEGMDVTLRMAFVEFTPPEGMPWVKPIPPSLLLDAATRILDGESKGKTQAYIAEEGFEKDGSVCELKKALDWTARVSPGAHQHLVVIAGSLYLVADFYRLLQSNS